MHLLKNIAATFRGRKTDSDLNDELRFHLEREIELNLARGMSADEARRQALIAFGGVQQTRENVRQVRWTHFIETLLHDLRYAMRLLAKSPGFTAVAIAMLALGVGANTAIFTVIDAVLLKPLPYPNADRLVEIRETFGKFGTGPTSSPNFRDWQEQSKSFSQLVGYFATNKNFQDVASPERVHTILATANLFDALESRPLHGRAFVPADQALTSPQTAVISGGLWRRRFAADPELVGKTITLDSEPYTVVGIMPDDFRFPAVSDHNTDVWLPLRPSHEQAAQRGNHWMSVIGIMRPGVDLAGATADLKTVAKRLETQYPEQAKRTVLIKPLQEYLVGSTRSALFALLGAVGLVLLIACANLASLLLVRTAARRREISVRLALGASQGRIRRQFITESLLLALAGGGAGALVAYGAVRALTSLASREVPRLAEVRLDLHAFLFLLGVSLVAGLLFALAPVLQSPALNLLESLKTTSVTASSRHINMKLRDALMVTEVALALVLLVGAGLLIRTFYILRSTDPGFVTENVLTLHLSVPEKKYPGETVITGFYQPLLEKIQSLPGVQSAGAISLLPIQNAWTNTAVNVEGHPKPEPGHEVWAEFRTISSGYFGALGIALSKGRNFQESDTSKSPGVLLINEELARQCFPNESPIGKHILFDKPWTIVGVVRNVKQASLQVPALPELYISYLQNPDALHDDMTLVVRGSLPPESLVGAVRNSVTSLDPSQPVYDIETMQQVIADSISSCKLYMMLLGIFAGVALLLAMIGLYGVISFLVARRTVEFGIRLALGAPPGHVLFWVLKQSLRLIGAGVAIGLVASFAATRVLTSVLYGVKATDPGTFVALSLLLSGVGLAAAYFPARRATKVDPAVVLRYE
jgi:predicted permease